MADVLMPQLGETVTEGTITRWMKAVGEFVKRDEPLFEVSTDKVDSEVPAPASGVLAEVRVPEGDTVDVGTVLAVIAEDGAGDGSQPAPAAPPAPGPAVPAPAAPPPPAPGPAVAAPPAPAPAPAAPPAPAVPAPAAPPPAPAPTPAAPDAGPTSSPSSPATGFGAQVLSPVVRRLLAENAIDPSTVTGTGVGGRITRADVLDAIDARRAGGGPAPAGMSPGSTSPGVTTASGVAPASTAPASPAPASTFTPAAPGAAPGAAPPAPAAQYASGDVSTVKSGAGPGAATGMQLPSAGTDEVIPFTNIRRRTAEHMVRSKATSAHTLVIHEADYERVDQVRRAHKESFRAEEGFALTYLPFVARAVAEALQRWDHLNSSVGEDSLIVHHQVNLGIAVDLDHEGLIVPVVVRAEELTLRGIARRINDLATRARSKRLTADDIGGGTFSITNAGSYGTFITAPIINQPQVAILSTDGIKRRPVVVQAADGTEAIAVHSVGLLCLAWDHRAVDGSYAAGFVADVADMIATHDWSAEL